MGMMPGNEQEKPQLVLEICNIWARAVACVHSNKPPFIDWYLVLQINENADTAAIRKQYHKLALQLHPDKNKHSKAETAFKLVSEAYYCLSDDARRAAFDSGRTNNLCMYCNTTPSQPINIATKTRKPHQESSRFSRIKRRMEELKTRLEEEATIIDKCLTANATTLRTECSESRFIRTELPTFNPSDYYRHEGYPHHRTINLKKLENLRSGFMMGNVGTNRMGNNDTPIFQCRPVRSGFMSRSASTRDV